jgi:hypothetical protein
MRGSNSRAGWRRRCWVAQVVAALLARSETDWGLVPRLVAQGLLTETEYRGPLFYRRGRV